MSNSVWYEVLFDSFADMWARFVGFLPELIGALLVLIVGWFLAALIGRFVARLIEALFIEKLLERLQVKQAIKKIGFDVNFAKLIGWLVKWFLIIVVFITAADILGLPEVTDFLNTIVLYVPQAVAAALILLVGFVVAAFVGEVVEKAVKSTKLHAGHSMATITRWAIIVFTVLAVLEQLGVGDDLIRIILMGFVAMLALAGGLAFGLGGRDMAAQLLDRLHGQLGKKR